MDARLKKFFLDGFGGEVMISLYHNRLIALGNYLIVPDRFHKKVDKRLFAYYTTSKSKFGLAGALCEMSLIRLHLVAYPQNVRPRCCFVYHRRRVN